MVISQYHSSMGVFTCVLVMCGSICFRAKALYYPQVVNMQKWQDSPERYGKPFLACVCVCVLACLHLFVFGSYSLLRHCVCLYVTLACMFLYACVSRCVKNVCMCICVFVHSACPCLLFKLEISG